MIKDHDENSWLPNIIKSVASENSGIDDIAFEIERHKSFMREKNRFQSKEIIKPKLELRKLLSIN